MRISSHQITVPLFVYGDVEKQQQQQQQQQSLFSLAWCKALTTRDVIHKL